jgi:hypothetical protein
MDELDTLRAEAAALGVKVDGRWGVDRLRAEVSAAQSEEGDEEGSDDDGLDVELDGDDLADGGDADRDDELGEPDATDDELADELEADDEPQHVRAGGYIDRGDGRGWVLEE